MKALEIIKNSKGIKSIEKQDGIYSIYYYTRLGNVAIEEGNESQVSEILAFNASLPSFRQKRIQSR